MTKLKLLIATSVVIVILGLFHFVPVSSKSGYIDHTINGSATCFGYPENNPKNYRVIVGGFKGFENDKKLLVSIPDSASDKSAACGFEPIKLRLYLL